MKKNKKRLSLKEKAYHANGLSRACSTCLKHGSEIICMICTNAFVEGYTKGYKTKTKELKTK